MDESANTHARRSRLGRGLDAILPTSPPLTAREGSPARIEDLYPNHDQPRKHFDDAKLDELASSIREHGLLEPILVRKRPAGGYEIIAGERRWRAAQRVGLRDVPIFVRELSPEAAFEAALVENLQREDLNPVETARAFARLIEEHGHTQETVAGRVGKDRSTVANALRLLKLPARVLELVESGALSEGHGRAILGALEAPSMVRLAEQVVEKGYSVRETERKARIAVDSRPRRTTAPKSVNVRDLEQRLSHSLGSKVAIVDRKGKGRLEISFTSYEDLDRILALLL